MRKQKSQTVCDRSGREENNYFVNLIITERKKNLKVNGDLL
jgi:hypothetical protein